MKVDQLLMKNNLPSYVTSIQELADKVFPPQQEKLLGVAARMAETIRLDGRIFTFGTGHSHMICEEGFYRAGGLACVVPIFHSALMLHENVDLSSRLERTPGLVETILKPYTILPGDMLFIFSNSGVNHMIVEMALAGKERGAFLVSISSLAYARKAPLSALGKRLDEVADIALDNGGEPGDSLIPLEGTPWRVAASSTAITGMMWNSLLVMCSEKLQQAGVEVPVFASLNMPGAAEHNRQLLQHWCKRNPHLSE